MKKLLETEPFPYKVLLTLFAVWILLSAYLFANTSGKGWLSHDGSKLVEANELWLQNRSGKLTEPVQLPFRNKSIAGSALELSWDPGLVANDQQLILHTTHTLVKVYCLDELIDSFGFPHIGASSVSSLGEAWHMVRLPQPYPGRVVIHLTSVFPDEGVQLDSVFLGNSLSLVRYLWNEHGIELIACLVVILLGLTSCVFPVIQKNRKRLYGCLFLGLFFFNLGLWAMLSNPLLQLLLDDSSDKIYIIRWLLLLVLPVPLLLYAHMFYKTARRDLIFVLISVHILLLFLSCAFQSLQIADFHRLRWVYCGIYGLSFVTLISILIQDFHKNREFHTLVLLAGLGCLGAGGVLMMLEGNLVHWAYSAKIFHMAMVAGVFCLFSVSVQVVNQPEIIRPTRKLLDMVFKDPITHVRNRAAYEDVVSMYQGRMEESGLGLVMVDINHLKSVNDTMGHRAGDQYLQECCKVICQAFESFDVFRVGGDEFVVLLRECSPQRAEMLLKKLREKIQEYESARGESLSMAVGYSFASLGDRSMEDVFQRADREMYRDKRSQQQAEWTWRRERKTNEAS